MRNQYVIEVNKDGYMKYISHLDMMKLFKNAFKKAGIKLAYSQGFNPHPKMGFAQPLSLGYSSSCELLEFETKDDCQPAEILEQLQKSIPKGIEIFSCNKFTNKKSFAARTYAATYEITIPMSIEKSKILNPDTNNQSLSDLIDGFMNQEKIVASKRQKKTGTQVEVNIKDMIRTLTLTLSDSGELKLTATLDSGSHSNLSPELVFAAFAAFADINTAREDVEIKRTKLFFN